MNSQTQTLPATIPYSGVPDKNQTHRQILSYPASPPPNCTHDEKTSIPAQAQQRDDNLVQVFTQVLYAKPNLELFKCSGEATTYTRFVTTFEAIIETSKRNCRLRLLYLTQHCESTPKSLIQHCVFLYPEMGNDKTKQLIYYTTLGHMQYYSDLNPFENMSKVAKRLPSGLQNR